MNKEGRNQIIQSASQIVNRFFDGDFGGACNIVDLACIVTLVIRTLR